MNLAGDSDRVRSALNYVPAHDRDTWLRMGMAVKHELGEDGFELWDNWSQQADSYNATDARDVWRSIRGNGKVTTGTLFHEAKVNGWHDDGAYRVPDPIEIAERRRAAAERAGKSEAETLRNRADAATRATAVWKAATPARGDHPYLARKRVAPVSTLRELDAGAAATILGYQPRSGGELLTGRLIVAPVKVGDTLSTLELIDEVGRKSALFGGAKAGGYWAAQPLPDANLVDVVLLIGEGVATALSAREATEHPALAALSCGNLESVARDMRERYPAARLVILADVGAGQKHAEAAALAVGGLLAVPDFGTDRPDDDTDFNDLARHFGAEAVKRAIASAKAPEVSEAQPGQENATAEDLEGREWPEPRPLPDALASVQAFASELLPESLRAWCDDISDRVQCPPDFVGVAAVAALGAVLGRKVAVRPQERTDWSEVANQWALVVGRPGVMKSPAIEQALAPLRRLETIAREKHGADLSAFRADETARKLRVKANEREAERAIARNRTADVSHLLRDQEADLETPSCRRYSTSDTSAESLAELVRLNPNGLLVHRDEMVSLLRDLDREEKASARGFYLTGWNGSTPYTVDRLGRGLDLNIPAICLSLLGGTQPARIAGYVHAAVHGRGGDDGLIQRFGLLVWPDLSGDWRNVDRWPDSSARRSVWETFKRLDESTPEMVGAVQDTGFTGEPEGVPYLRLTESARERFVAWRAELERRLRSHELAPAIESHLAKYRKLVPSLALLFHVADGGVGPIGEPPMLRALAWSSYLESHATRLYGSGPASEAAAARAIVARIRAGDLLAAFAGWQVWRPGWAGLADRETVLNGLELLVDLDYLAIERIKTAGRDATRYVVNPKVLL